MSWHKLMLFSCCIICHPSLAQLVDTSKITGSINQINDRLTNQVENLEDRIQDNVDLPFSLSELPPIESLSKAPLSALPLQISVGTNVLQPALIDVEVENGWRAIKQQWFLLSDPQTKLLLIDLGATIISEKHYQGLDLSLLQFEVPAHLDSTQALAEHLPKDVIESLARNHVYQTQNKQTAEQVQLTNQTSKAFCHDSIKVGMIDSAIDVHHRAFAQAQIISRDLLPESADSPTFHGSAVAGVMVGRVNNQEPLNKNATLYSAQVFYAQSNYSQGAPLDAIIASLDWLLTEQVPVVNMSLAGPDNPMLKRIIQQAHKKGMWIVAAAGNKGPASAPLYPAAYEPVFAVSAIDSAMQAYRWSVRGEHIDFSALGVNVLTVKAGGDYATESGTSMAAPVVTMALSCLIKQHTNPLSKSEILKRMRKVIKDEGPKGRDPVYGEGVVI
ncbi:S8 family serine peptidase [Paraglaciecola aquimarina]|uniref:S8 family serine peptidase n=1 Tax=Paraglaciecola algarum TaxID=3050085 RepID=A0ABS9D8Z9_9ALTE|nr:S8 family serine peptidase [Paraglaciecola sp. G1-23]MCF2949394.1 S8 family serine peptidase [Paraglaciecola sp. G1-23]